MLTQSEIDALLSGALPATENEEGLKDESGKLKAGGGAGAADASTAHAAKKPKDEGIRPYNFWSPDRFSKEQVRAVDVMHEDLAERLATSLPPLLRTNLKPRVVFSEQGRFHDLLRDLQPGGLFHLITMQPLPGQMVITISMNINQVILEYRLGGRADRVHKKTELTEIDQMLLRDVIAHILPDIKAAWGKIVAIQPQLEESTTNYHWVQMTMGNDKVMLIAFELVFQDTTGIMNVYIPYSMLKPIAHLLRPHAWLTGGKERANDPDAHQNAFERISNIKVPFRVILGNAALTVSELANLQPGDILQLDTPVQQDLTIQVVNRQLFSARIGQISDRRSTAPHLAVQITERATPDTLSSALYREAANL